MKIQKNLLIATIKILVISAIFYPSLAFGSSQHSNIIHKNGSQCPSYWRSYKSDYCIKRSSSSPDAIVKIGSQCPSYWTDSEGDYCIKR